MISVIVITYNRADLLEKCLQSVINQKQRPDYEIIVIDNCSTDRTQALINEKYSNQVRLIRNSERLGLAECKKLALSNARGDSIAFIDDDCEAGRDWLSTIRDSIQNYDSIGGPVLGSVGTAFPRWWRKSLNWLIGVNPSPSLSYLPLGSNVAFKKYVLEDTLTQTQAAANLLPYTEDNCRIRQVLRKGYTLGIVRQMCVYHRVPPERLKIRYLLKRARREGTAQACTDRGRAVFLLNFLRIFYNSLLLLFTLDYNRFFRAVAYISYIMNFFFVDAHIRKNHIHVPRLLILDTTHSCNLQCVMCELWKTARNDVALDREAIKNILSQAAALKIPEIALSGGEPLLRDDIFDLFEYARKINVKNLGVLTNGILVEKYFGRLTPYLVDNTISLVISLDSLKPEIHNAIRNSAIAYQKTTECLTMLASLKKRHSGVSFNVITILLNQNLEELLGLARFVRSLGANSLQFQALIANNLKMAERNVSHNWIRPESLPLLDKTIDDLIDFKKNNPRFLRNSLNNLALMKKYFRGQLNKDDVQCTSAYNTVLIGNTGTYATCFSYYGSTKETTLKDVLTGKQIIKARENVKKCPSPCLLPCFCDN